VYFYPNQKTKTYEIQNTKECFILVTRPNSPYPLEWSPAAFTVTFKLETDPELLSTKASKALHTYGHQLVVGNILSTRRSSVIFYTKTGEGVEHAEHSTSNPDTQELEEIIVRELLMQYRNFAK